MLNINLLANRIIVKKLSWEETSDQGIIIRNEGKERLVRGEVLYVGPGRERADGTVVPCKSKPGDIIYYGKALGIDFMLFGEKYEIFKEDDAFFICNDQGSSLEETFR